MSSQVLSALKGLTSVFGMGTGGTPSSLPPEMVNVVVAFGEAAALPASLTLPLVPFRLDFGTSSAASQLFPPHVAAAALAHPDNCTGEESLSDRLLFCLLISFDKQRACLRALALGLAVIKPSTD